MVLVDAGAALRPQVAVSRGKHGGVGMLLVVPLERVADRFHAPAEPFGDTAMHVGRAGSRDRKPPSPRDDLPVFVVVELAELAAPLDPQRVFANEPLDRAGKKANPPPAVDRVSLGDKAMVAPPRDRLGGHAEPPGQLLDGEHLLASHDGATRHDRGFCVHETISGHVFERPNKAFTCSTGTHDHSPAGSRASCCGESRQTHGLIAQAPAPLRPSCDRDTPSHACGGHP